jgi:hypothetical protein
MLESRLEELGVLRAFSRPRVLNDNAFSKSLFSTAKYRPDYPSRPFASVEEARSMGCGIKFVTPHQCHGGDAAEICRHLAVAYEKAGQSNPRLCSRSTRCWREQEEMWIKPPPACRMTQLHYLVRVAWMLK